jgi:hypothetical protein
VTGRRKGVAGLLAPLNAKTHKELMTIRATHVAHLDRASSRETTSISARLSLETDRLRLEIDTRGVKEVLPTVSALPDFAAVMAEALSAAEEAYDRTVDLVRQSVGRIPTSDLMDAARRGRPITLEDQSTHETL